jgi:hypothetical protein
VVAGEHRRDDLENIAEVAVALRLVVAIVAHWIGAMFASSEWKKQEAAVVVYGCAVENSDLESQSYA